MNLLPHPPLPQVAGSAGIQLDLLADAASHAAKAKLEAIWAAQEAEAADADKDGLPSGLVAFPSITSDVKLADLGELVHTYVTPPGPLGSGPHPCFGELALLYGGLVCGASWHIGEGRCWAHRHNAPCCNTKKARLYLLCP
jgi:hypothetical protein